MYFLLNKNLYCSMKSKKLNGKNKFIAEIPNSQKTEKHF